MGCPDIEQLELLAQVCVPNQCPPLKLWANVLVSSNLKSNKENPRQVCVCLCVCVHGGSTDECQAKLWGSRWALGNSLPMLSPEEADFCTSNGARELCHPTGT